MSKQAIIDYITDNGAGVMFHLVEISLGYTPGFEKVVVIMRDPTEEQPSLVKEFDSFPEALDAIKSFFKEETK